MSRPPYQPRVRSGTGWVPQHNGSYARWCGPGWPKDLDPAHRDALIEAGWTWDQWSLAMDWAQDGDDWTATRYQADVLAVVSGTEFLALKREQRTWADKGERIDERLADALAMGAPWLLLKDLVRFPFLGGQAHIGGVHLVAALFGLNRPQTVGWALARQLQHHPRRAGSTEAAIARWNKTKPWRDAFGDHAYLLRLLGYRSLPKAKQAYEQMRRRTDGTQIDDVEIEEGLRTLLLLQKGLHIPTQEWWP